MNIRVAVCIHPDYFITKAGYAVNSVTTLVKGKKYYIADANDLLHGPTVWALEYTDVPPTEDDMYSNGSYYAERFDVEPDRLTADQLAEFL